MLRTRATKPASAGLAVLVGLLALAAALAAIGSAAGGDAFVVEKQGATVKGISARAVIADCPSGGRVVGGGFSAPSERTVTLASRPASTAGWQVRVGNHLEPKHRFASYAICQQGGSGLVIKQRAMPVAPLKAGSVTVGCDPGARAIGGGFFVSRLHDAGMPLASYPTDDGGWGVRVNSFDSRRYRFRGYAICSSGGAFVVEKTTATAPAGRAASAVADCGPGAQLVSGGFQAPTSDTLTLASRPRTATEGWMVRVKNAANEEQMFNAYAICTA